MQKSVDSPCVQFILSQNKQTRKRPVNFVSIVLLLFTFRLAVVMHCFSHLWARCLMGLNKQTKHNCVFKKWNYLTLVLLFFLLVFRLIFFPFHFFYCHVAGIFPHLPYSDLSQALRWPFSSPVPGVLLTAVN